VLVTEDHLGCVVGHAFLSQIVTAAENKSLKLDVFAIPSLQTNPALFITCY